MRKEIQHTRQRHDKKAYFNYIAITIINQHAIIKTRTISAEKCGFLLLQVSLHYSCI